MLADWRAESNVSVVQESSSRINYRGGWQLAYHPDYLGGKARGTDAAGAKASLRFRGVAVSWVGPAGPTRGKARVYIDGTHVATVNTWAATFRPTRVLFKTSWDSVGSHKIAIVAIGTRGHPTVALDAFLVRLDSGDAPDPVDDAGAPIGTAPPGESPAPSATPAPSPTPDAAPSATPTASPTPAPTPLPTPTATPAPTPLPTATPAPTPLPTATPAPTPLPTATPAPATGDPWAVAFGTRPRSGAISLNGCRDVVISNKTFRDLGANVIAIRLENCTNVTISAVDFINVAEGVYALNSSNIRIIDSRYQNITGPHERDGHNRGNFVQLNNISGGLIDHNKGKGGDTEDVVSIYRSSNVVIEDNHFEGTNWTSTSGSGIALGDGGGSGNVARRNVLVNVGQVGAFIAGGSGNRIEGNTIYGAQRELSNVGIYVWAQGSSCSNATVSGNKVWFKNAAGQLNGFWNGGNCGQVTMSGNDFNAPLNLEALGVAL